MGIKGHYRNNGESNGKEHGKLNGNYYSGLRVANAEESKPDSAYGVEAVLEFQTFDQACALVLVNNSFQVMIVYVFGSGFGQTEDLH